MCEQSSPSRGFVSETHYFCRCSVFPVWLHSGKHNSTLSYLFRSEVFMYTDSWMSDTNFYFSISILNWIFIEVKSPGSFCWLFVRHVHITGLLFTQTCSITINKAHNNNHIKYFYLNSPQNHKSKERANLNELKYFFFFSFLSSFLLQTYIYVLCI